MPGSMQPYFFITIKNNAIECVDCFKYLSVTLDPKLKFQHHIDKLTSVASIII